MGLARLAVRKWAGEGVLKKSTTKQETDQSVLSHAQPQAKGPAVGGPAVNNRSTEYVLGTFARGPCFWSEFSSYITALIELYIK